MIPTFIVEEHHEAFGVWFFAVARQIIAARQNTLLHVDDHSDLSAPRLTASLKELEASPRAAAAFARQQLGIGDFIVPAVYLGLFKEIFWLKQGRKYLAQEQFVNVFSQNADGRTLIVTDNFMIAGMFNPDRHAAVMRQVDCADAIAPTGAVVLDIDLDYFGCDSLTGEAWRVEVSEAEYCAARDDPYHRLRLKFGGKLHLATAAGKFYFEYESGLIQDPAAFDRDKIGARIDQFGAWLDTNHIQPALIDVCRSRFSGYTPTAHWQWIEERVLDGLRQRYALAAQEIE